MPILNFVRLLFLRSWYRARMQAAQNQTKPKLPKNSGYLASDFCFVLFFTVFSWNIFFSYKLFLLFFSLRG